MNRQELIGIISDMWKEFYGSRPYHLDSLTDSELQTRYENLIKHMEEENQRQAAFVESRWQQFQRKIEELIEMGAGNRTTALRWLFEADEVEPFDTTTCIWRWGFLDSPYEEPLLLELEGLK